MIATRFEQSNIEFTKPKGWTDEECHSIHGFIGRLADEKRTPVCITAWRPTPEELVKINLGAPIFLTIVGGEQPPVKVEVENPWGN